jgi:iron complex outermembrane receptor protein
MNWKVALMAASALSGAAVGSGTALAAAPAAGSASVGEIVVTAQKRTEDIQKVPLAVTPVGGTKLRSQGVVDVRQLGHLVPAIILGQDYIYTQIDIRGVGANNDAPALDPAVAFNIDGVYQPRDYGTYGSFFDVDRVEVLRGPQGTLYGRNSTGGSINLITNKPVQAFHAAGELDYGNYNSLRTSGMLNVPLGDTLAIRGAFQQSKHDGYLSTGFNDQDSFAGRLQALYRPNSSVSLLIGGDYFRDDSKGAHTVVGLPYKDPSDPWFDPLSPLPDDHSKFTAWSVHGQLDVDLGGGVTLTDIPAYKHVDIDSKDPVVGVYSAALSTDKAFSNELRIASPSMSRIKWVGGFYYFKEDDYSNSLYYSHTPFFSFDSSTINPNISEHSWALFGQATYPITDSVRLTGGLRYSSDTKEATGENNVTLTFPFSPPYPLIVHLPPTPDDFPPTTWHHLDWRVGVDADLSPTTMVYANIATGYLEGGFNLGSRVGLLPNFDPEKLTAYTIGGKNTFDGGRIRVNAEAFYYDYKDYIVSVYLTQGAAAGQFALFNTPAKIYGGEIESTFQLTPDDSLNANVALLHGRYGTFEQTFVSTGLQNLSGKALMRSPNVSFQAGYEHTFHLSNGAAILFNVQTHYDSSYWTLFDHTPGTKQPAYTKTNLVLTYQFQGGHWRVEGYVNNIENAPVIATAAPPNSSSGTVPWVHQEEPRLFGFRVAASY